MNAIKNILILQKSANLPDGLRELLRTNGYVAHTVFNLKTASEKLGKIQMGIILIDCGDNEHATHDVLKGLTDSSSSLCQYPTILVTSAAAAIKNSISESFLLATALTAPCSAADILQAIAELNNGFGSYLDKLQELDPELASTVKKMTPPVAGVITKAAQISGGFETKEAGVSSVLTRISSRENQGNSPSAEALLKHVTEEVLNEFAVIPDKPLIKTMLESINASLDTASRDSIYRSSLLTGLASKSLGLTGGLYDNVIAAQLRMQQELKSKEFTIARKNYLLNESDKTCKEIATAIEAASKDPVLDKLELSSEMLLAASELIRGSRASEDTKGDLSASTILLSDLVDRVCFRAGFWNPRDGYQILYRFRGGSFSHYHPEAVSKIILLLSSLLREQKLRLLIPRKHCVDRKVWKASLQKANRAAPRADEQKIPVNELRSGMTLSRPLEALDGKVILDAGITLDSDLIFRIWELSAIRGLALPLFVKLERELPLY